MSQDVRAGHTYLHDVLRNTFEIGNLSKVAYIILAALVGLQTLCMHVEIYVWQKVNIYERAPKIQCKHTEKAAMK